MQQTETNQIKFDALKTKSDRSQRLRETFKGFDDLQLSHDGSIVCVFGRSVIRNSDLSKTSMAWSFRIELQKINLKFRI